MGPRTKWAGSCKLASRIFQNTGREFQRGIPEYDVSGPCIPGGRSSCPAQAYRSLPVVEILGVLLGWKVRGHESLAQHISGQE